MLVGLLRAICGRNSPARELPLVLDPRALEPLAFDLGDTELTKWLVAAGRRKFGALSGAGGRITERLNMLERYVRNATVTSAKSKISSRTSSPMKSIADENAPRMILPDMIICIMAGNENQMTNVDDVNTEFLMSCVFRALRCALLHDEKTKSNLKSVVLI